MDRKKQSILVKFLYGVLCLVLAFLWKGPDFSMGILLIYLLLDVFFTRGTSAKRDKERLAALYTEKDVIFSILLSAAMVALYFLLWQVVKDVVSPNGTGFYIFSFIPLTRGLIELRHAHILNERSDKAT